MKSASARAIFGFHCKGESRFDASGERHAASFAMSIKAITRFQNAGLRLDRLEGSSVGRF